MRERGRERERAEKDRSSARKMAFRKWVSNDARLGKRRKLVERKKKRGRKGESNQRWVKIEIEKDWERKWNRKLNTLSW